MIGKCYVCNQPLNEHNGYIEEKKINGAKMSLYICESCKAKEEAKIETTPRRETNAVDMILWSIIGGILGIVIFAGVTGLIEVLLQDRYLYSTVLSLAGAYMIFWLEKKYVNSSFVVSEKIYLTTVALIFYFISMYLVSILRGLIGGATFGEIFNLLRADPLILMPYTWDFLAWVLFVIVGFSMWSMLPGYHVIKKKYRKV